MTAVIQLVTLPTADTPQTCIQVRHERGQYIFGRVAEGTQRAFTSRKTSFAGTNHIFLTGSTGWDQFGGLMGFLLSMAGATKSSRDAEIATNQDREKKGQKLRPVTKSKAVGVHAGDNISHLLACTRGFVFRQPLNMRLHEHRDDPRVVDPSNVEPDWQDDFFKVWKIPTIRERSSSPIKRRRSSVDGAKSDGKTGEMTGESSVTPSDSDVARLIVENCLFNGELDPKTSLIQTKIRNLKPTDIAFIKNHGSFSLYTPSSNTLGEDTTVWVLASKESAEAATESMNLKFIPLPKASYSERSMSYIVKAMDRRGKFDRAAAEALGVECKNFRLLTSGQNAPGKDGQIVTPDMVMGTPVPGKGFIVADIASRDFLDSFMQRPEWTNTTLMTNITVMYWMLGSGMSTDPQIQKFMADHADIKHILCAPDTCPNMISIASSAEMQMKLRRIDPERFPLLNFDNTVNTVAPTSLPNVELGRVGKTVQIMPRVLFEDSQVAPFPDLVAASQSTIPEVMNIAEECKIKATNPDFLSKIADLEKDIPNRDAEIICLGTGSSCPSTYRNVSCTMLRVPGIGTYLFDAGEGTLGQIRRLYGTDKTAEILRDLKCLVMSHLHADHHLGAPSLLRAWYEQTLQDGRSDNLAVACNPRYRQFLEEVAQVEDFGIHRLQFPCSPPNNQSPGAIDLPLATATEHFGNTFGLKAIKRIPITHCYRSMATELELTSGLRVAYSGDCRPSTDFATACQDAHLLIHECTFADDMGAHARAKNHSTVSEALGVAAEMRARRVLLTHFSQRYVKAAALRLGGGEQGVLMGFDFMRVRLGEFLAAAEYLPALEVLVEKLMDKEE